MQSVQTGRVTSIRPVKIEGGNQTGALLGGVAGGFLGHNIGKGSAANTAGAIGGALVGSAVGSHAEQAMNSRQGIDITVKLDGGAGTVSIVQQVNPREEFYVGDRVKVLGSGSGTRVTH
ncbi:MAG: glycine zipper 2TM domain-containing protein [Verrucomicrobia bacterium]|nr:glycine zipper 2TM domain-containing protein [Verrucomicrobiota bacterium]